ncbi:MAG TPA: UDP-N-acetylglucosamine--N-acetylmuramyl-(pentapeptide) pyrophosphoryl-undecaprenol N-acetylglucosamine transferase [Patescibacteria group bacterium]|nr:UDP-N-acetylglucosamine--N-acetylmuramyl-(pentapeptide) pyrophosphoryl-undecaprenol N-acetylglucosamine transferase [Patescibacteria group bacterium]
MKILITGGHFSPALALIRELKLRGHEVAIAGRKHPFEGDPSESYEYQAASAEKIKFYEIKAGRFQRKFTVFTLTSLFRTPAGYLNARSIISEFLPDVVVTFGGYIGLPIAYAAWSMRIPVVLHEQTQKAGVAAKLIGRIATKICTSFESSGKYFDKNKTILTGNPVRPEIFKITKKIDVGNIGKKKVIYVTGGSTGSHFINEQIGQILTELLKDHLIIHQTGESRFGDFEALSAKREQLHTDLKQHYILRKFIKPDEIGYIYSISDLIVARSGINTVMEIIATGKRCVLIPLSHGQTGEQHDNARLIKELGIGDYLLERIVTPETLLSKIHEVERESQEFKENLVEAKKIIIPDAAARLAEIVENVKA